MTLAMMCSSNPSDIVDYSLRLNYGTAWLQRRPAFDGAEGTNADAAFRFLLQVVRRRRAISGWVWAQQILALALYTATPLPPAASELAHAPRSAPDSKGGVRVLVVGGDEDRFYSVKAMSDTAARLQARFELLKGVGHNVMVQDALQVNKLLARHFAGDGSVDLHNEVATGIAPAAPACNDLEDSSVSPTEQNKLLW